MAPRLPAPSRTRLRWRLTLAVTLVLAIALAPLGRLAEASRDRCASTCPMHARVAKVHCHSGMMRVDAARAAGSACAAFRPPACMGHSGMPSAVSDVALASAPVAPQPARAIGTVRAYQGRSSRPDDPPDSPPPRRLAPDA